MSTFLPDVCEFCISARQGKRVGVYLCLWDCVACARFLHVCEQMCVCLGVHCPHVCAHALERRGLKSTYVLAPGLGLGETGWPNVRQSRVHTPLTRAHTSELAEQGGAAGETVGELPGWGSE